MTFKYQIEDLNILSELELPMLTPSHFEKEDIKILIKPNIKAPKKNIEIKNNRILYKDIYKNIFLIKDKEIHIFFNNQDHKKDAGITIMGIPIGYLLQKNRFQVLHGSSVASKTNESAVAFIGKSGAGKSSIALELVSCGLKLVTEDLCIIKNTNIYNFSNWIKSSRSVIPKKLSHSNEILINKDSRKRSLFKIHKKHISKSKIKLKAIYFLSDANETKITKLKSTDAFKYLFTYAYRPNDKDKKSLDNLTKLCKNTECFLFSRNLNKPFHENKKIIFNHLNQNFLIIG